MCERLEHRGPDSRGIHLDDNVALAIQRLRVIDLETGDQPIYDERGSVVVVLNGEIYNHRELRRDLAGRGHRFRTRGDTEVIAHLYEEAGPACVELLDGMFALALWDSATETLMLARDRVGKKPLLYSTGDGVITFASEMRALLAAVDSPRPDPIAVDEYLALGYVPEPRSAVEGIRKLPAAHRLVVAPGGRPRIERYWSLDYSAKSAADVDELCARVRSGIRSATAKRLVADVPVGAFLSGGIDSSAVVAAMAEASSRPVRTFSVGFDDDRFDELPHARRIAELFATEHTEFRVDAGAVELLPTVVRHHGEPFADPTSIPTFQLAEMTRRHVTVALNGDGGDESFGGYSRYVANSLAARLARIPPPLRRAAAGVGGRLPAGGEPSLMRNRARRLLGGLALAPAARYARYVEWVGAERRADLYAADFAAEVWPAEDPLVGAWEEGGADAIVDRMLEVDVRTYLVGDLLPKVDIATMAHGLEARSPFLDPALMELAASIPGELKIRGGEKKWILRRALRGTIPDDLLDRPKQGFSVPLSRWLRGELRDWSRDVLLDRPTLMRGYFRPRGIERLLRGHDDGDESLAKPIWALIVLELWHRELIDAPSPALALAAA